jgi:hypothetical protein
MKSHLLFFVGRHDRRRKTADPAEPFADLSAN